MVTERASTRFRMMWKLKYKRNKEKELKKLTNYFLRRGRRRKSKSRNTLSEQFQCASQLPLASMVVAKRHRRGNLQNWLHYKQSAATRRKSIVSNLTSSFFLSFFRSFSLSIYLYLGSLCSFLIEVRCCASQPWRTDNWQGTLHQPLPTYSQTRASTHARPSLSPNFVSLSLFLSSSLIFSFFLSFFLPFFSSCQIMKSKAFSYRNKGQRINPSMN